MEYKDNDKVLGVFKDAEDETTECVNRQFARQYCSDKDPSGKKTEIMFKEMGAVQSNPPFGARLDYVKASLAGKVQVRTLRNNSLSRPTIR